MPEAAAGGSGGCWCCWVWWRTENVPPLRRNGCSEPARAGTELCTRRLIYDPEINVVWRDGFWRARRYSRRGQQRAADADSRFVSAPNRTPRAAVRILRAGPDGEVSMALTMHSRLDPAAVSEAGRSLRQRRQQVGLSVPGLSRALSLPDPAWWEAVEGGLAAVSFELLLRLAPVLAPADSGQFVIDHTRHYNPQLWDALRGWALGRQAERA